MTQQRTKYPIGVQDFEGLIHDGYKYVDKTGLMYQLIGELKYVFLSRPRRFGKSLLLSTLKAFFEGKRELFKGLAVEQLETEWTARPVLYLDLNAQRYDSVEALGSILNECLSDWEAQYHLQADDRPLSIRFARVIRAAHEQTGHRVVILVDEYDKPMVMNMRRPELQDELCDQLKAFYGVMKSEDAHIRFAMLTGVTKFTKVSVFSDLNNLRDISMSKRYATLCGLTRQEIITHFSAELDALAEAKEMTREACIEALRRHYDGYHFAPDTEGIYNPFSVLNTLLEQEFKDYWFETGTPTLLYDMMRETDFDLQGLVDNEVTGDLLGSIETMHETPLPLIFQSGYLTIKGYDEEFDNYRLGFPNEEVERSFTRFLLPLYAPKARGIFNLTKFVGSVRKGQPADFMLRLQALTSDTTYEMVGDAEKYFHNVLFLFFRLMGFYTEVEHCTSDGRMDMVVKTPDYIYLFEFKINKTAAEGLQQIHDNHYADAFAADPRRLFLIGVTFSTEERRIKDYLIE